MPRLMRPLNAHTQQRDTFVGRLRELTEFRNSVRYVLGRDSPPSATPFYPHIFLTHGEGGMGKSALLRQFIRIAREEGLSSERIILIDLDYKQFPTVDALEQTFMQALRLQFPGFDRRYQEARVRRDALATRYRDLERQWLRWEVLRASSDNDLDRLLDAHRRTLMYTEIQRAAFGSTYAPVHLTAQADQAMEDLSAILAFRTERGHTPLSFDELLQREFGVDAVLFGVGDGLGQALADDLYTLAEIEPILLAIDTYERADKYDGWLRTTLLANSSDQMITVIAGRNRLDANYQRTFSGEYANLIRSYNLNDQTLQLNEVKEYLQRRLKLPHDPAVDVVVEVHAISRGIPVALDALGDQLAGGGDLSPYRGIDLHKLDRRSVVHTVTERFLRYALNDRNDDQQTRDRKLRDRQRIRAMALLLRPDAPLICALWNTSLPQGQELVSVLADRYSFIFAGYGPYEMHDLVREFVRVDTLAEGHYSFDWPSLQEGLHRSLLIIQERIGQIERRVSDIYECHEHSAWRESILDLLNTLLWLQEYDQAFNVLLNRCIEAWYVNSLLTDAIVNIATELIPKTPEWSRLLQALRLEDYTLLEPYEALLESHTRVILLSLLTQQPQIREAVGHVMTRFKSQLISRKEFERRTLRQLHQDISAEPNRAALYTYSQVLHRACSGVEGAQRQNVAYTELLGYIYESAKRRYPGISEDVAQRAIQQIFISFDRCHQPGAFLSFALQQTFDAARYLLRADIYSQQSLQNMRSFQQQYDPTARIISNELLSRFEQLFTEFLQKHPRASKQLAVLRLKYIEGMDDQAISQMLGVSVKSVQALRYRALQRLRNEASWQALAMEFNIIPDISDTPHE